MFLALGIGLNILGSILLKTDKIRLLIYAEFFITVLMI